MEAEIRPEPTPEERAAVLAALDDDQPTPYESEWRRAGLPGDDGDDDSAK